MKAKLQNDSTTVSLSRRNALKTLAVGSFIAAAPTLRLTRAKMPVCRPMIRRSLLKAYTKRVF